MPDYEGKTLLLVEDDAVIALAESSILKKYGYQVVPVHTGLDAVDATRKYPEIDLILMDIDLGEGIDGTEAAEIILLERDIPIVFLSSHTEPEIVARTEKITSYGYVAKNSGNTVLDASIKMAFRLFEANREVREKEKLLFSIAENFPNSFISIIENDFTISFFSGKEYKNQDIDPQKYTGISINNIISNNPEMVRDFLERTFHGEECVFDYESDGNYYMVQTVPLYSAEGRIQQILEVVENVTIRRMSEFRLRESEEKFRQIYENMTVGIARVSLDFTIKNANHAYCSMLGYKESELIGKHLKDFTAPDIIEENMMKQRELAEGKIDHYRMEKRFIHRDGSLIHGILDANLVRGHDGEPAYFLGSVLDITARKNTEIEVRRQLEQKEIILKEIHHRIKNNLANIENLLHLQSSSAVSDEVQSALQKATGRVSSMRVLYDKLLQTEEYQDTSAKYYLENLIDDIMSLYPLSDRIRLQKNIDDFILDSKRLFLMGLITNELITNAMKYAFTGRYEGLIQVTLKLNDDCVTLAVEDNGNGLPENFDMEKSGGFGLTLVGILSQQLKGTFSLEAKNGTLARIEFHIS